MQHTSEASASDGRVAYGHATYPGNVTTGIANDVATARPFGPNYMGELMWPVDAVYDTATDTTRVGFSHQAPKAAAQ